VEYTWAGGSREAARCTFSAMSYRCKGEVKRAEIVAIVTFTLEPVAGKEQRQKMSTALAGLLVGGGK